MSVLAEKNNAIMLSYGMAAASLTGAKCSRNFFRACLNTDTQSFALARWVAKSGYKKVIGIVQDYSFGHEALAAFMKKVKELNPSIEVVGELYHKAGEKDFAPYVSQIIGSGAEVVWTPNWGNDLTLLIKQGGTLGMKAKIACYYLNDEYLIESVADDSAIVGNITAEAYMLTIPTAKNKEFIDYLKHRGFSRKDIHTSGHADIPTLQRMAEIINPSTIVPIHTFEPEAFQNYFSYPVKIMRDKEILPL